MIYIAEVIFFGEKMAQALVDHLAGEAIGQAASFQNCFIDKLAIEVLGKFQFGSIDVDHLVGECLGKTPNLSVVELDHLVGECIGQWAGF